MGRFVKDLPFGGQADAAFAAIQQYMASEGFEYIQYKGEYLFKKGIGLLTAPNFVKVTFNPGTVRLEAWIKYALLPGVYVGEIGMDGFVGAAAKGPMKKAATQIELMIQNFNRAAQNASTEGNPEDYMFCGHCGGKIPKTATFCSLCGKPPVQQ